MRPVMFACFLAYGCLLTACGGSSAGMLPASSSPAPPVGSAKPAASTAAASPVASAKAAASAAASGLVTLKVAHVPSTLFTPLYVAIDKGYMKNQGLDASLTTVAAGQDAQVFLANGQLDAAVAGISAATFNAINQGLDVRIVGSMGVAPANADPSALMVRSDELDSGAIKSAADLKAKKVGLTGGSGATGSYYMAQILAKSNLTLADIDVINLGFPDMVAGLKNKSLDAALPSAPFTTQILSDATAKIPDFGHLMPGVSGTGTMYGPRLLGQDRPLGQKFFNALVRGAADLQSDKARSSENLDILAKYTKIPTDTLKTMALYDFKPDLAPDTPTYTNMQKVFTQAGILKFPQPLPPDKVVDDAFSKAAKPG